MNVKNPVHGFDSPLYSSMIKQLQSGKITAGDITPFFCFYPFSLKSRLDYTNDMWSIFRNVGLHFEIDHTTFCYVEVAQKEVK